MKIFVYGTLADPADLSRCAGQPVRALPVAAELPGYARVVLRGTRYPTLRRAPRRAVAGVIMRVNANMLARLQAYESARYRQIHVRCRTAIGQQRARCFIGDAATKVAWRPNKKSMSLRSRSF